MLRRLLAHLFRPADKNEWLRRGLRHRDLGEVHEAAECFERALALAPDSTAALANLAAALRELGRIDESLALFERARQLAPGNLPVFSAYLFTLNLAVRRKRDDIFAAHLEFGRLLEGPAPPPRPARRAAGTRLRLGYFSPDLRRHAVAFFVEPLLEHHDRRRFEVTCYALGGDSDPTRERLRARAERWRECGGMAASDLAGRIAADGIDILVDLAGHTAGSRLDVLALKPAPVIATWLGYLNTTGLSSVDYRITDRHADPPGLTERFHTETLAYLPESQWCRSPPEPVPGVSPLPALARGAPAFGSFNNPNKLNPDVLANWARILRALPRATLLFAAVEGRAADDLRRTFAVAGVDPARLAFAPRMALERFRALHHDVDIALDAHPYSGATTTLESLWMGVPTLTLVGDAPVSRSTASLLRTLGLPEWIAGDPDELVRLAVHHARDLDALAALRARLRPMLQASTLMDGARFVPQLEALYERMWRERGGGPPPG